MKINLDNIRVRMYGINLHIHEIKNISALESRIRTIYELEGIVEESDEVIKTMQAKIALACGNPEEVKRLMKLLKKDSQQINFIEAYIAGRKSYLAGEDIEVGFTNYFRELCLSPQAVELSNQLQSCCYSIISSIRYDDLKCYVTWLMEEYRTMYSKVKSILMNFLKWGTNIYRSLRKKGDTYHPMLLL